jgi:hypothetical protein
MITAALASHDDKTKPRSRSERARFRIERAAKALKNNQVAKKQRNRNSTVKYALPLRVGLNLRLKNESVRSMMAALGKVDPNDPLVYCISVSLYLSCKYLCQDSMYLCSPLNNHYL